MTRSLSQIKSCINRDRGLVETPPDVLELLAEGKRQVAVLEAQAADARALERVRRRVKYCMTLIDNTASPWTRARRLGDLADWLSRKDMHDLFMRSAAVPHRWKIKIRPLPREVEVPRWVPGSLCARYRMEAIAGGEIEAARLVRRLKAEGET